MLTKTDFNALLARRHTLIIDGALATELEARGHDLNHPLWSAKLLQDDPDGIEQVHLDYYLAGADIAITASYQASTQGLYDHFGMNDEDAASLIKTSVRLAQKARAEAYQRSGEKRHDLLVAGSVGPYGAFLADGSEYRGDYQRSAEEFKDFHRPRILALTQADVDLLAIETMPSMPEIQAVCSLLQSEFPDYVAWVSCTLKDADHLSDGTPLQDVLALVQQYEQIVAFGINCVPTTLVMPALQFLSSATQQGAADDSDSTSAFPLLCYPNSGEIWDAGSKTWKGPKPYGHVLANQVRKWTSAGARLVGGCCRTGPKNIEAISQALRGG